jgi:hypothetical protein
VRAGLEFIANGFPVYTVNGFELLVLMWTTTLHIVLLIYSIYCRWFLFLGNLFRLVFFFGEGGGPDDYPIKYKRRMCCIAMPVHVCTCPCALLLRPMYTNQQGVLFRGGSCYKTLIV